MDPQKLTPEALKTFEQHLHKLQAQAQDLKQWVELEGIPPDQWAEMQEQLQGLEERMQGYLEGVVEELNQPPAAFWQAVRFGGLGILLGMALQRFLGS